MSHGLKIRPAEKGGLDFLALGALVHRLDPGIIPFRKARECEIHVSGGEFNCAANLADCFELSTGVATAMVNYPIGDLIAERVRAIGPQRLSRFFVERRAAREGLCYEVTPELAALITFRQLNLMHSLPMKGPLDVIFCRNVVIYFDKDTQRELFARVAHLQRPGDVLCLGHSESLFKVSESYAPIGKTIYRRS